MEAAAGSAKAPSRPGSQSRQPVWLPTRCRGPEHVAVGRMPGGGGTVRDPSLLTPGEHAGVVSGLSSGVGPGGRGSLVALSGDRDGWPAGEWCRVSPVPAGRGRPCADKCPGDGGRGGRARRVGSRAVSDGRTGLGLGRRRGRVGTLAASVSPVASGSVSSGGAGEALAGLAWALDVAVTAVAWNGSALDAATVALPAADSATSAASHGGPCQTHLGQSARLRSDPSCAAAPALQRRPAGPDPYCRVGSVQPRDLGRGPERV